MLYKYITEPVNQFFCSICFVMEQLNNYKTEKKIKNKRNINNNNTEIENRPSVSKNVYIESSPSHERWSHVR